MMVTITIFILWKNLSDKKPAMSRRIVISQPMLFPWPGMFEQIALADIYVHYNDVSFSKGSRVNRVQIKGPEGPAWMTIPLQGLHMGQQIRDVLVHEKPWRDQHKTIFARYYQTAKHLDDALELVERIYQTDSQKMIDIVQPSIEATCDYLGIAGHAEFMDISTLGVEGVGSQRVIDIVKKLDGDTYLTGHGASNYLDHQAFDDAGIRVEYMDYSLTEYPQLHGKFTPYVSVLDMIANIGRQSSTILKPRTLYWKDFIHGSH